ncbi:MAG: hypothetical protein AMXMBFR7_41770 [Planctomycetota bacterium]
MALYFIFMLFWTGAVGGTAYGVGRMVWPELRRSGHKVQFRIADLWAIFFSFAPVMLLFGFCYRQYEVDRNPNPLVPLFAFWALFVMLGGQLAAGLWACVDLRSGRQGSNLDALSTIVSLWAYSALGGLVTGMLAVPAYILAAVAATFTGILPKP